MHRHLTSRTHIIHSFVQANDDDGGGDVEQRKKNVAKRKRKSMFLPVVS